MKSKTARPIVKVLILGTVGIFCILVPYYFITAENLPVRYKNLLFLRDVFRYVGIGILMLAVLSSFNIIIREDN